MMQWEYKLIEGKELKEGFPGDREMMQWSNEELLALRTTNLNALGEDGWELIVFGRTLVFKRLKP